MHARPIRGDSLNATLPLLTNMRFLLPSQAIRPPTGAGEASTVFLATPTSPQDQRRGLPRVVWVYVNILTASGSPDRHLFTAGFLVTHLLTSVDQLRALSHPDTAIIQHIATVRTCSLPTRATCDLSLGVQPPNTRFPTITAPAAPKAAIPVLRHPRLTPSAAALTLTTGTCHPQCVYVAPCVRHV